MENSTAISELENNIISSLDHDLAKFWVDTVDVSKFKMQRRWHSDKCRRVKNPWKDRGNCDCYLSEEFRIVEKKSPLKDKKTYLLFTPQIFIAVLISFILPVPFSFLAVILFSLGYTFGMITFKDFKSEKVVVDSSRMGKEYYLYQKIRDLSKDVAMVSIQNNLDSLADTIKIGLILKSKLVDRIRNIQEFQHKISSHRKNNQDTTKALEELEKQEQAIAKALDSFEDSIKDCELQIDLIASALSYNQFMKDIAGFISVEDLDDGEMIAALKAVEFKIKDSLTSIEFLSPSNQESC